MAHKDNNRDESNGANLCSEKLRKDPTSDQEDADEYISRRVSWVPTEARWIILRRNRLEIGQLRDETMNEEVAETGN